MSENSIEFSLSNSEQRDSWLNSSHWTLDADKAKLQARIKPTALCSAIDKKNSIEFLLDSVHYLYMKSNLNPSLLSCTSL